MARTYEEMKDTYLLTECLHPIEVENKYTHELMYVPCGQCASCLCRKSNLHTSALVQFAQDYRYCYFVTLTYSDEFLPKLRISAYTEDFIDTVGDDGKKHRVPFEIPVSESDIKSHDSDDKRIIMRAETVNRDITIKYESGHPLHINDEYHTFDYPTDYQDLHYLIKKANSRFSYEKRCVVTPPLSECTMLIPYICYRDFDTFMKRLRQQFELLDPESKDEKIRYYTVSEYGPRSHRPHWHMLLFFNAESKTKVVGECIRKSWKLGNTSTELSRGHCAGYVASYVNSYISLHKLYKRYKWMRPRTYHSKGVVPNRQFPQQADIQEADDIASQCLDGLSDERDGKLYTVRPTRSYLTRLFPRFSDPFFKDVDSVVNLYESVLSCYDRCMRAGCCVLSDGYLTDDNCKTSDYTRMYVDYLRSYTAVGSYSWRGFAADIPSYNVKTRLLHPTDADKYILIAARIDDAAVLDLCTFYDKIYRLFATVKRTLGFWRIRHEDTGRHGKLLRLARCTFDFWSRRSLGRMKEYFTYLESCPKDAFQYLYAYSCGSSLHAWKTKGVSIETRVNPFDPNGDKMDPEYRASINSVQSRIREHYNKVLDKKTKHKEFQDLLGSCMPI